MIFPTHVASIEKYRARTHAWAKDAYALNLRPCNGPCKLNRSMAGGRYHQGKFYCAECAAKLPHLFPPPPEEICGEMGKSQFATYVERLNEKRTFMSSGMKSRLTRLQKRGAETSLKANWRPLIEQVQALWSDLEKSLARA